MISIRCPSSYKTPSVARAEEESGTVAARAVVTPSIIGFMIMAQWGSFGKVREKQSVLPPVFRNGIVTKDGFRLSIQRL